MAESIGGFLTRSVAIVAGLLIPALVVSWLAGLQLASEPDLPGGYEGLDGFLALVVGVPSGLVAVLVGALRPMPSRRRFLVAVGVLQVVLVLLGLADLFDHEWVR